MNKIVETANWVIDRQIEGLEGIRESIAEKFPDLIKLISGIKGKVILSGMGKSGHIANKIAATMASTGTPAFFVHPSEASHGDLGMITKDDCVILLSNSGETAELKDIILYSRYNEIPLIGVVRRPKSLLVEQANISFVLPELKEASLVNAPTTSTTMMLVWGDCLAVALAENKGFSKEEFNKFHPGGSLGSQFTKVSEIMRKDSAHLPICNKNDTIENVILSISKYALGCTAICENGKLIGIVTDGDLRRYFNEIDKKTKAEDLMTKDPISCNEDTLATEALSVIQKNDIQVLPVVNKENELKGIISFHQLIDKGVF